MLHEGAGREHTRVTDMVRLGIEYVSRLVLGLGLGREVSWEGVRK